MTLRAKSMGTSEAYVTFFNDLMLERRTALPAYITKVNTTGGALVSVDVRPAILHTITEPNGIDQRTQELPIISGVPVVMPRSQTTGFSLTIPLAVGDEVLLVVADRSIDNWQSTGRVSRPSEPVVSRSHDLTDAIAIVGISNGMTSIPNYSFEAIELRNKENSISVSVSDSTVVVNNNGVKISVEGDTILMDNGNSSITIESHKITIDSPLVEITGSSLELASSSNVTTGGGMTSSGGLDSDNHVHSDPQGGQTGGPINP